MPLNPFDPNHLADLWLAGTKAMLDAQQQATRSVAQTMQSLGTPSDPGLPSASADLAGASQSMIEMWTAATSLFQTLTAKLPTGETSAATEATLRSMMDPRSWAAGVGEMDGVLARMAHGVAGGPRFADLWDVERRYARVMAAWIEVRRAGLEHNAVVLQAWMEAGQAFTEEWAGHTSIEAATPDAKQAMAIWTETANRKLLETQRSEPFLRTQTGTIRATTELRMAQQDLVEHVGKNYGFPTRTELDDVHRTVTELRRELRAMKRAQREATPVAQPAPVGEPALPQPVPANRARRAAKRSA